MHFWKGPLLVGAVALLAGCGDQKASSPGVPQVGVVTLAQQSVELTNDLPGRIAAAETSEVRPQIGGIIRRRLFAEGSMVKAGQVLYEIEDAPYRAQVGVAQGNLAKAQATIESTRLQSERYRGLIAINAVSRQDLDNAESAARQARADVAAHKSTLDVARVNLDFTRIRAPISGRIGRSIYTPGALVQAGQANALATIQRTDSVFVDVTQSAAQLLDLKEALARGGLDEAEGARVQLILPNGRLYPIEGRLQFTEVSVDPQTGSVTLRATFANPQGLLLPGMFVRARIVEGVRQNAILAPQQGITRDPRGRATALVVNSQNKIEQRSIVADRAVGNKWVVTDGLKPGDRLVVEGVTGRKTGELVKPVAPQQITVPDDKTPASKGR